MLVKIITKKLNYRIVDHLLDRVGTVTSIAMNIKSKKANVSKALRELEKENIVAKDIVGRSHRYRLNFFHPEAKEIIKFFLMNRANQLNSRLDNLPKFIDAYLKQALGNGYFGLVVFGSALTAKYKDIDVFIIAADLKKRELIIENLKLINEKISPIVGTKKELEEGFRNNDSLYLNIINGVPFGCLDFIADLRNRNDFLKRKDLEDRFIIGYREINSCKKFKEDKAYIKGHLEKGIFDIAYSLLNYNGLVVKNDAEARQLFNKIFKCKLPSTLNQAAAFAEIMKKVIFY